ncbi:MAG TPA: hypothetical protein PLI57_08320 [Spirochaetota bacterium]|nr:hypothetical protein [Spirochaetota bacterium]
MRHFISQDNLTHMCQIFIGKHSGAYSPICVNSSSKSACVAYASILFLTHLW